MEIRTVGVMATQTAVQRLRCAWTGIGAVLVAGVVALVLLHSRHAEAAGEAARVEQELQLSDQALTSEERAKKGKQYLALAWQLVKKDKPDEAAAQRFSAAELGVHDEKLDRAIDATPTALRRKALEQQQAIRAEREERRRTELDNRREEQRRADSPPSYQALAAELGMLDGAYSKVDERGWGSNGCGAVADRVRQKIDYSADAQEKSRLRKLLQKSEACSTTSGSLTNEGGRLAVKCNDVLLEIVNNVLPPAGSDAHTRRKRGFDDCMRLIAAYRSRVEVHVQIIEAVKTGAGSVL